MGQPGSVLIHCGLPEQAALAGHTYVRDPPQIRIVTPYALSGASQCIGDAHLR